MKEFPVKIANSDELEEKGHGLRFELSEGRAAFAIRFEGQVRAYLNECRHLPTELDWNFGHFLDADKEFFICASHGAMFDPKDGLCVSGPCRGKSLYALDVVETNSEVLLLSENILKI